MENSVGRLPNQVVRNRANSSGKGPAHMENTYKILTINIVGLPSSPDSFRTGPARLEKCQLIGTKLKLKKHENIVCQPLNQLAATGPTHLERGQFIRKT